MNRYGLPLDHKPKLALFFTLPAGHHFVTRSGLDFVKVKPECQTTCEKCRRPIDSARGLGDLANHRIHVCPREIVRPVEFLERHEERYGR